jgi:hypothetical protein
MGHQFIEVYCKFLQIGTCCDDTDEEILHVGEGGILIVRDLQFFQSRYSLAFVCALFQSLMKVFLFDAVFLQGPNLTCSLMSVCASFLTSGSYQNEVIRNMKLWPL